MLELVTVRITATTAGAEVALGPAEGSGEPARGHRTARIGSAEVEVEVLGGDLPPGTETSGPAVIELPESTVLVPPGWAALVDQAGSVCLKRA
jgi:N-methylhydantoinase A